MCARCSFILFTTPPAPCSCIIYNHDVIDRHELPTVFSHGPHASSMEEVKESFPLRARIIFETCRGGSATYTVLHRLATRTFSVQLSQIMEVSRAQEHLLACSIQVFLQVLLIFVSRLTQNEDFLCLLH